MKVTSESEVCSINGDTQTPNFSGFFFNDSIIFLFLAVLGLCCCVVFSLVAECGGCSLVEVLGLLIAVASLVEEHRL